jgi:hypothetical protein
VEIKPLYKKGKIANTSNYRPISLLISFSKIFEKIIYTRLIRHLNHNHILIDEQFGFSTKSSMYLTSYKLINDVLMSLNNKLLGGVFCDLQKAFDCVDHDILLSKMNWYGISGKEYKLLSSYLQNIYHRVIIANKSKRYYSKWEPIRYGIPQGSILGPSFFFILYKNDLPKTIAHLANPVLFANNTSMIISKSDPKEFTNTINRNIIKINEWFKSNSLSLNTDKTYFLQFHMKTN